MKAAIAVTVLALGTLTLAQQPGTAPKPAPQGTQQNKDSKLAFPLLQEAYGLAQQLPTDRRIAVLAAICDQAASFAEFAVHDTTYRQRHSAMPGPSQQRQSTLHDWAEELYLLGNEYPAQSPERSRAHSSATRAMVVLNPKRALQMLDEFEGPAPGQPDARQFVSWRVFAAVLQQDGPKAVPQLRQKMLEMAAGGRYPYIAAGELLGRLDSHPAYQRQIFGDMLSAFQQSDSYGEITGILMPLRDPRLRAHLDAYQLRDAVNEIVERARRTVADEKKAIDSGAPGRPGLKYTLTSIREMLKAIDPDAAAAIPEAPPVRLRPIEVAKASAPAPPRDAEVERLSDEFEQTRNALMVMNEQENYTRPDLRQTIDKGIDQGAEVVRRRLSSEDDQASALESTAAPLLDFVQISTRLDRATTLGAVRKVQDPELRIRLLLTMASMLQG